MNIISFLFQCFLSLLLCYASLVSVYISIVKKSDFSFLNLFFILSLVSFTVFSIYRIYKSEKKIQLKKQLLRKNILFIFIICLVSFLLGFFNIYTQYLRGMFFDELTQFSLSVNLSSIIEASTKQQQPPLDYYFSAFSNELWEQQSKVSIRFHAILFYLILSFILPLGIYRFSSSLSITSLGTLLFLINHVVRLHSMYARPLSLTLLTGFFFLFFYLSYFNGRDSEKQSLFPVIASQYLFVMSIGLQPVIFIISLFFSSFWLFSDNKKTVFKNLFLSHFVTALLALPFYITIYLYGKLSFIKQVSLKSIHNYILDFNLLDLFKKYFPPFYEQLLPLFFLLVALLIVISMSKRASRLTMMTGSALILFPLLYDFIFHTVINHPYFPDRYFIVLSLFFILFVVLSLREIYLYLQPIKWKYFWIIPMTVLFFGCTYFQILAIKNKTQFKFPYLDNSMEQVYDYLIKEGTPNDIAIDFSLVSILETYFKIAYEHKGILYEPEFHPKIIQMKRVRSKTENIKFYVYYIDWKEMSRKGQQKLFFIHSDYNSTFNETRNILSHFMRCRDFSRHTVCVLLFKEKDKRKEYLNFLSELIKKTPKKLSPRLYETLLYYACENKDGNFSQLLKDYKELESALHEVNPDYGFPDYFELRRRVNYFKDKNCSKSINKEAL